MPTATLEQGNSATVRAFIEAFWNERDPGSIERFLDPTYVDHAYTPPTADGLATTAATLAAAFPDQRSTIESVIAEGTGWWRASRCGARTAVRFAARRPPATRSR